MPYDTTSLKTKLSDRIEDPSNNSFSTSQLETILDASAQWVMNAVDYIYLSNFVNEKNVTISVGSVGFSTIGITNESQLLTIQRNSATESKSFIDIIPYSEYKSKWGNEYFVGNSEYPIAYTHRDNLLLDPPMTKDVTVKFYVNPSGLGTISGNVEFPLNLEDILLDIAESQVWKMDNKLDRYQSALKSAVDQVTILNQKVGRA